MAKAKDLRDQSLEELQVLYRDLNRKVFESRNIQKSEKKTEEGHLLRQMRKDIARILTIMREKQLAS